MDIDKLQIKSRSILYPVLKVNTLLAVFTYNTLYNLCFPLSIDQLQIKSISIPYPVLKVNTLIDVFCQNPNSTTTQLNLT